MTSQAGLGLPQPVLVSSPPSSRHDATTHVLVADDTPTCATTLRALLRERWRVTAVADGRDALELALREPPDLVLTDVMMPNLDGFGLLGELRAREATRSLPVIMLSARAGEESRAWKAWKQEPTTTWSSLSRRGSCWPRVATHLQIARLRGEAQAQRARLFAILMEAPTPVAVLSGPELVFELANTPFCRMLGREQLIGRTLREAFTEPSAASAIAAVEGAYRRGETLRVTEQHVPLVRDGELQDGYYSYVVQPIFEATGEPNGLMVVANDMTESVLARQRVDELRQAAERANRAKDEFLSTLSHELRTRSTRSSAGRGWCAPAPSHRGKPSERSRPSNATRAFRRGWWKTCSICPASSKASW